MKDLKIIENIPDFNTKDLDEIMLSIGWTTQENIDKSPDFVQYKVFQSFDYYALAKIGDKTVGILEANSDKDRYFTTYLSSVVVHKDYQRKGIGTSLMQAFSKRYGHTVVWANAPQNRAEGAEEFLAKCGYKDNSKDYKVYINWEGRKKRSYQ